MDKYLLVQILEFYYRITCKASRATTKCYPTLKIFCTKFYFYNWHRLNGGQPHFDDYFFDCTLWATLTCNHTVLVIIHCVCDSLKIKHEDFFLSYSSYAPDPSPGKEQSLKQFVKRGRSRGRERRPSGKLGRLFQDHQLQEPIPLTWLSTDCVTGSALL